MTWDVFTALNAGSGLLLVAVGCWSAFNPRQGLGLPLFLMAWGSQVALTNATTVPGAGSAAPWLFWLSMVFLPLQAVLLFYHVAHKAADDPDPARRRRIVNISRAVCFVAAACMALGAALAIIPQGRQLLQDGDDLVLRDTAWPRLLFDAPQYIGVALALALLARQASTKQDHLLVTGLALAWLYVLAFTLFVVHTSRLEQAILFAAAAIVGFAFVYNLQRSRQADSKAVTILSGVALVAALVFAFAIHWLPKPTQAPAWTDPLAWSGPGTFRLLALLWLVPALAYSGFRNALRDPKLQVRALGLGFTLVAIIVATSTVGIGGVVWTAYAAGLVLAAGFVLIFMSGIQVRQILAIRV